MLFRASAFLKVRTCHYETIRHFVFRPTNTFDEKCVCFRLTKRFVSFIPDAHVLPVHISVCVQHGIQLISHKGRTNKLNYNLTMFRTNSQQKKQPQEEWYNQTCNIYTVYCLIIINNRTAYVNRHIHVIVIERKDL